MAIDSLWLSDFWATMYVAAALRGVKCYALAPSPVNAPSSGNFQMFLAHQNLRALMRAGEVLKEDLAKSGGAIHVALYDPEFGVNDTPARAQALLEGLDGQPFILEDFPINDEVIQMVREYAAKVADEEPDSSQMGVRPSLHMKTQFYATRSAMQIMRLPEWRNVVLRYESIREKQRAGESNEGLTPFALTGVPEGSDKPTPLVESWQQYMTTMSPEEREQIIYAFTIGSQNQDRRGMVQDGEVLALLSGYTALIGVIDMIGMVGGATWPKTIEEFDALFPEPSMSTRFKALSRYFQNLF